MAEPLRKQGAFPEAGGDVKCGGAVPQGYEAQRSTLDGVAGGNIIACETRFGWKHSTLTTQTGPRAARFAVGHLIQERIGVGQLSADRAHFREQA